MSTKKVGPRLALGFRRLPGARDGVGLSTVLGVEIGWRASSAACALEGEPCVTGSA
jgi:hypothetical protein